jgi:site-specific DNA recombinase
MSPTHANKNGVRYRYRRRFCRIARREPAASPASRPPDIESLVCDGVRRHLAVEEAEPAAALPERELIERHVLRVIAAPQALEVCFNSASEASAQNDDPTLDDSCNPPITITLPWTAPSFKALKCIIHEPGAKPTMKPESRDALLTAIAKARGWLDDIGLGRVASFAEIAEREAVGERHIRLLAPLAFLSPASLR